VVSNTSVYLVSTNKVHSKFEVQHLKYYIKALQSNEFILHVESKKEKIDCRLSATNRDSLEEILRRDFFALCPDKTLRFYGIPGSTLAQFKTNNAFHLDNEPE